MKMLIFYFTNFAPFLIPYSFSRWIFKKKGDPYLFYLQFLDFYQDLPDKGTGRLDRNHAQSSYQDICQKMTPGLKPAVFCQLS